MKLWLAGNFPILSDPKKEMGLYKRITEYKSEYKRLVSFYYKKETMVVLNLKKEMIENARQPKSTNIKVRKGLVKRQTGSGEDGGDAQTKMSLDKGPKISSGRGPLGIK